MNFDLQLLESANVEKERKMWSIDACLYFYRITFSLVFFFYHLVFLSFLFPLHVFSSLFFPTSPPCFAFFLPPLPTVHGYPLLYYLPLWDLPLLSLNHFWLLVGFFPRLPTNLLVVQPLPLSRVCWLYHSPFLNKITCLVSYLSLFLFNLNG